MSVQSGGGSVPCRGLRVMASVAFSVLAVAVLATPASAEIIVSLAGGGSGTVTSSPVGIECSNIGGGAPGPSCNASFGPEPVGLTAAPGGGSAFVGWEGDDPFPGFFGPTCNEGSANPCATFDPTAFFGSGSTHITATFCPSPIEPPTATTGQTSAGGDFSLRTLEGTVDPEGCPVLESYFEYGTSTEYGSTTPTEPDPAGIGTGSSPVTVSASTEPLEPETTYHYRLVAVGAGTSKGEDRTFTTGPAPSGGCPNEARRHEQGSKALLLPDCMALEMISPPQKAGRAAYYPNVSADGSRVSFISQAALGENPQPALSIKGGPYVASRGESGWITEGTVPPDKGLSKLWDYPSETRPSFTPDFSRWFGVGGTSAQVERGIGRAYEAGLGGFFVPLSDPLVPLSFPSPPRKVILLAEFAGASADHTHLYFQPGGVAGAPGTYLPSDPILSTDPGAEEANTYLVRLGAGGQPALELLQRDRTGKVWGGRCGARLGGIGTVSGLGLSTPNGLRNQGAVSVDGSRTYFSARASQPQEGSCKIENKLRILERLETPSGPVIHPLFSPECARVSSPCSGADGDDLYQGGSLDQTKVYFTTNRQLASSDLDGTGANCSTTAAVAGCDLYLYDSIRAAGERLIQVSAGEDVPGEHEMGKEANVYNGITAISADGSHVYFVATGVLTNHTNPAGDSAHLGEPNLYMWDAESEETTFLGTLAAPQGPEGPEGPEDPGDAIFFHNDNGHGLWGGQGTWRNNAYPVPVLSPTEQSGERSEEGGDGHILVFESRAELTPNDADGRHLDVYRYDAEAETLRCLSCAPGSSESEPDEEPFDVDDRGDEGIMGTDFAESRRWVSEDGAEIGFDTAEGLVPGDVDGAKNGYLWREGELFRLPGVPFRRSEATASQLGPFLSHDGSTMAFTTQTPLLPQDGDTAGDVYVARVDGGFPNPQPHICEPGNPSNECQKSQQVPAAPQAASEAAGPGNPLRRHPCPKGTARRHGRCVKPHKHRSRHRARHANSYRRVGK
jgi:hypothetical protein